MKLPEMIVTGLGRIPLGKHPPWMDSSTASSVRIAGWKDRLGHKRAISTEKCGKNNRQLQTMRIQLEEKRVAEDLGRSPIHSG